MLPSSDNLHLYGNKEPVCPYCGVVFSIDRHEAYWLYDQEEDDVQLTCDTCLEKFNCAIRINYVFDTHEQEDD